MSNIKDKSDNFKTIFRTATFFIAEGKRSICIQQLMREGSDKFRLLVPINRTITKTIIINGNTARQLILQYQDALAQQSAAGHDSWYVPPVEVFYTAARLRH